MYSLILNDYKYKYLLISYSLPISISTLHWVTSYNLYIPLKILLQPTCYRLKQIKLFGNVPRTTGNIYPVMLIDKMAITSNKYNSVSYYDSL